MEIAINLWIANMSWEDYVGSSDHPDDADNQAIEAWNIEEPSA